MTITKRSQGRQGGINFEDHVAAPAPVAAVGAAPRLIRSPVETDDAVAPVAAPDPDFHLVDKGPQGLSPFARQQRYVDLAGFVMHPHGSRSQQPGQSRVPGETLVQGARLVAQAGICY